jgi:hypothetical protein
VHFRNPFRMSCHSRLLIKNRMVDKIFAMRQKMAFLSYQSYIMIPYPSLFVYYYL